MDKVSKVIAGAAVLAAIILIGLGVGWFASRTPEISTAPAPDLQNVSDPAPPPSRTVPDPRAAAPSATNAVTVPVPASTALTPDPTESVATTWEDQVDDILASDMDDTNKVNQLFAMFPRLDKDGQAEVAQHLSNLVEDEEYEPLGKLLLDPTLSTEVLDLLFDDVLNRATSVKLPMFLGIARLPEHPNREDAHDLLELYLDEDYGQNWAVWEQKMEEWLKENPE